MHTLRRATTADAALITAHRHRMFADNSFSTEDQLDAMDASFEPWVQERLADGRYVGLLLEQDGTAVASAGIHFADFPPHYLHVEPGRAYLLNFYTDPSARGQGLANQLLRACVDECRTHGSKVVTLHASPFGRPIYEKFGFTPMNEMMMKL
ncbi:MAG: GNAT family N-acetyltransferase [Janthinobacterium lividum]